jgi:hypothetical protein
MIPHGAFDAVVDKTHVVRVVEKPQKAVRPLCKELNFVAP